MEDLKENYYLKSFEFNNNININKIKNINFIFLDKN